MPQSNKKVTLRSKQGKNVTRKPVKKPAGKSVSRAKSPVKKAPVKKTMVAVKARKPAVKKSTSNSKKLPQKKKGMQTRAVAKKNKTTTKTNVSTNKKSPSNPKAKLVATTTKKIEVVAKKPAVKKVAAKQPIAQAKKKQQQVVTKNPIENQSTKKSAILIKKPTTSVKKTSVNTTVKAKSDPPKHASHTASSVKKARGSGGPIGFNPYEEKQGEDYMNEAQLTHFNHVLNLWKEQLYADREATTQHMRDDSINFPDPLDRAVLEEEHTLEWRAREREHRLIAKIDQALARIKQGDYGYCEVCGAEIGVRRLEARPTATLCIDCKTVNEIRERQTGTVE